MCEKRIEEVTNWDSTPVPFGVGRIVKSQERDPRVPNQDLNGPQHFPYSLKERLRWDNGVTNTGLPWGQFRKPCGNGVPVTFSYKSNNSCHGTELPFVLQIFQNMN